MAWKEIAFGCIYTKEDPCLVRIKLSSTSQNQAQSVLIPLANINKLYFKLNQLNLGKRFFMEILATNVEISTGNILIKTYDFTTTAENISTYTVLDLKDYKQYKYIYFFYFLSEGIDYYTE